MSTDGNTNIFDSIWGTVTNVAETGLQWWKDVTIWEREMNDHDYGSQQTATGTQYPIDYGNNPSYTNNTPSKLDDMWLWVGAGSIAILAGLLLFKK